MIRYFICGWATALLFFSTPGMATEHPQLKAFPMPGLGSKRLVLQLPHKERDEETNFQIELQAGMIIETDGINRYQLGGTLVRKTLQGWGYSYYEYEGNTTIMSTLMGVPQGEPMVSRFVGSAPLTIPYNSRIPVVIYVPEEIKVQHRIWSTTESYEMIEED